jgi:hypothetical protein
MKHVTLRGVLQYRYLDGAERGRERFTVTRHGDGRRILRTCCEIDPDEVLRDVTYAVDEHFRPLDAFVRITVRDRFVGSGWFLFARDLATCETYTALEGRISQRIALETPAHAFGSHPITSDAWLTALFDPAGPREQYFTRLFISSYAFNGATGPMLLPVQFGLQHVGHERVTVPAGSFACNRYRFLLDDSEVAGHPAYDIWAMDGGDHLCVRALVGEPKNYLYELLEWQVS